MHSLKKLINWFQYKLADNTKSQKNYNWSEHSEKIVIDLNVYSLEETVMLIRQCLYFKLLMKFRSSILYLWKES